MKNIWDNQNLIKVLQENGVVVMPTDTIYGMVGKAENKTVVERIYKIRERSPQKPCIILIGNIDELKKFSINLSEEKKKELEKYWYFNSTDSTHDVRLKAISIVLDCEDENLEYLHRGTNTLAFRIPKIQVLQELLLKTGPLIAPSANKETYPTNDTAAAAEAYFGNSVDLYIDGGELKGKASKLIKLNNNGSVIVLRE